MLSVLALDLSVYVCRPLSKMQTLSDKLGMNSTPSTAVSIRFALKSLSSTRLAILLTDPTKILGQEESTLLTVRAEIMTTEQLVVRSRLSVTEELSHTSL